MRRFVKLLVPVAMVLLSACAANSDITESETVSEASLTESITEAESISETENIPETESVTETEASAETESITETEASAETESITETETLTEEVTGSISESMEYDVSEYNMDIALITEYENWVCGHTHNGKVIDMNGNVYSYDFSVEVYNGEEEEFDGDLLSELMKVCSEGSPDSSDYCGNTDTLQKIRELADGADRQAKMIYESAACDAGQDTIYAVTSDGGLVKICSDGDCIITSTDENALEIQRLCNEMGIY